MRAAIAWLVGEHGLQRRLGDLPRIGDVEPRRGDGLAAWTAPGTIEEMTVRKVESAAMLRVVDDVEGPRPLTGIEVLLEVAALIDCRLPLIPHSDPDRSIVVALRLGTPESSTSAADGYATL